MSTATSVDMNLINQLTGKQDENTKAITAQLAALAEQLKTVTANQEALSKENASLKAFQEKTKRIINTPADQVDANDLREVMLSVGISKEEVEKRLAGDDGDADGKGADPRDQQIEDLKKQVTSVAGSVAQNRSQVLRTHFDAKIAAALEGDKAFQAIYKAQVAAGKTKEAEALRSGASRLLERSAMRELNEAATATKGVVDEAMIDSVVPKVTGDLTTLTSAIEASTITGRSPDTGVTEYQVRYPKSKEPVKVPDFKGTEDIGFVETELDKWITDKLGRDIAQSDSETAESKV